MKITSNTPQNYINKTYTNQSAAKVEQESAQNTAATPTDSINLSSTTRDLQRISAAAETEPENRAAKVEALKAQVQSDQYTVNAEQVAEKMLGTYLDELG
jgi:negative regulator of flagellin synthesis FlgM